ncbi:hypothetical protein AVEN_138763-1 [Araneus ventricosus]|uniref:Uncharacterized protein n=1 Tax=Araneus ventricosus TaxID=182803 RepID=A0A4Y2FMM6_ARAVE|nr:hypothetical protein AVEN_138763-1 [Araneus ventricosus]
MESGFEPGALWSRSRRFTTRPLLPPNLQPLFFQVRGDKHNGRFTMDRPTLQLLVCMWSWGKGISNSPRIPGLAARDAERFASYLVDCRLRRKKVREISRVCR